MTNQSPHPMSREELLELAVADALGLLDEYEAALFTRSFHHAPIPVQDEIRALQAQVATDPLLLSNELPDPALGTQVLARVAQAIDEENSELAPLATIGRPRIDRDRREAPMVLTRSWQFWRAACFALAASLLVCIYLFVDATRHGRVVTNAALQASTQDYLRELIGGQFRDFVHNSACEEIHLVHASDRARGQATVYLNRTTGEAFLFGVGLPKDQGELRLSYRSESGETHAISALTVAAPVTGVRIDALPVAALSAVSWMLTDSAGVVLMQSA